MQDENGKEMSDEEITQIGVDLLSDACCFLYEVEDEQVIALAFMVDSALRYAQAIMNDRDPRLSADVEPDNVEAIQ